MPPSATSLARLLRITVDDLAARLAGASVAATVWQGRLPVLRAHTDADTGVVSDLQAALFEGPPARALETLRPVLVEDYRIERTWPAISRIAREKGVRAQRTAVALTAVGMLTVCVLSRRAGSLRDGTSQAGLHDQATVHAVTGLRLWAERELDRSSALVERACGVVMEREGCSADDALALLEVRACTTALTVPDVAAALLADHSRAAAVASLRAGLRRG